MIRMKRFLKKLLVSVICMALAAALMAVGVFADSSSSQSVRGNRQGGTGMKQGGKDRQGDMDYGDRVLSQIQEKITALEDENTKAALTQLLAAYENALEAEKAAAKSAFSTAQESLETPRKAAGNARDALASALTEAGIDIMNRQGYAENKNDGWPKNGSSDRGRNGPAFQMLDADAIDGLIAGLDNDTTKTALAKLLEAYKEALTAEKSGMSDDALTDDEKKTLHETVISAADALTDALSEAGIGSGSYHRSGKANRAAPQNASEQPDDASSVADDSGDGNGAAKAGIMQRILSWLGGFIK